MHECDYTKCVVMPIRWAQNCAKQSFLDATIPALYVVGVLGNWHCH